MEELIREKQRLRKEIAALKKRYSENYLADLSARILFFIEQSDFFISARKIFIYNNMPDEVSTSELMQKWMDRKEFYLPVTDGDHLFFRRCTSHTIFSKTIFGILEPDGVNCADLEDIDLIIIPGMAFDKEMNRMGRGKGYYDRFLVSVNSLKVGVCFDFQLFESIPSSVEDVKMDYIITERGIIG